MACSRGGDRGGKGGGKGGGSTFEAVDLTWQSKARTDLDWEGAGRYCASLTNSGGGWRLPTHGELLALFVARGPEGDEARRTDYWYWTSERRTFEDEVAFSRQMGSTPPTRAEYDREPDYQGAESVNMHIGNVIPTVLNARQRVRCVRGASTAPRPTELITPEMAYNKCVTENLVAVAEELGYNPRAKPKPAELEHVSEVVDRRCARFKQDP